MVGPQPTRPRMEKRPNLSTYRGPRDPMVMRAAWLWAGRFGRPGKRGLGSKSDCFEVRARFRRGKYHSTRNARRGRVGSLRFGTMSFLSGEERRHSRPGTKELTEDRNGHALSSSARFTSRSDR